MDSMLFDPGVLRGYIVSRALSLLLSAKKLNRDFEINLRGFGAFVVSLRKPLGSFFIAGTTIGARLKQTGAKWKRERVDRMGRNLFDLLRRPVG